MRNTLRTLSVITLSCLAALDATAGGLKRSTIAEIKAENARWAAAFAKGDYETIGALYTEGGELLPPGENRVVGGDAITAYFKKGYDASKPDQVSFSNYEFYGSDEAVTEISDNEIRDFEGNLKSLGKQTLIFLKVNGAWKLHRDMWSDNAPQNP